jgi:lipopolysaccharide transport system ATP-binding protein
VDLRHDRVGVGFNPILSGWEHLQPWAVLGFGRQEIAVKYDEIVGFAEIDELIDATLRLTH